MASATDRNGASALVFGFATIHVLLWTVILINLKAAQDVHMDVAEAFAWGQKFQLGYGKHPPLAGWIAGLWFDMFPVTDWATYLLAMTTLGIGLVISLADRNQRVVDYRRAFFVVVMLAIYPIFNFKGFKFNPDLLQLVTLPLLVLAYLNAFEKRTRALRPLARSCRCAGADDEILGADHDRRDRACRAYSSRSAAIPAVAGALGRDRRRRGGDDPASSVVERGGLRAADLCRRRLRESNPRAKARCWFSVMSSTIWRCWFCRW